MVVCIVMTKYLCTSSIMFVVSNYIHYAYVGILTNVFFIERFKSENYQNTIFLNIIY